MRSAPVPIAAPSPQRIVVAEDDRSLRELVAAALRHDGYEVLLAVDGTELLDRVHDLISHGRRVDLVVSDIKMPRMSGLTALELIRAEGHLMPVILMTAFSDLCTRDAVESYGAVLLDKPVELRTLRLAVGRALEPR